MVQRRGHRKIREKPTVILYVSINPHAGVTQRESTHMYLCWLGVVIPVILDVRLVDAPPGFTGFLIHLPSAVLALIFIAGKIQPSFSLVDREIELWAQIPSIAMFKKIIMLFARSATKS